MILLGTGWNALSTLREMHDREEGLRRDFLARTEPIVQVQSKLTIFGNLAEQFVVADGSPFSKAKEMFRQMETELKQYPSVRKPDEQKLVETLQAIIEDQDRSSTSLLDLRDAKRIQLVLNSETLPGQRKAIAAAEEIVSWNTGQLRAANSSLLADFTLLRARTKRLLFILLGCALIIAVGSFVMIAIQQREIQRRYSELSQNHAVQAQLSARLMESQEVERQAISRELHDEVGQSLGSLLVDLGRLATLVPAENETLRAIIGNIRSSAELSVNSVRNMALLLRPSMLDDLGLIAAIEWQAREVSRRTPVEVEVDAPEIQSDLGEEVKVCLYRLVQEALNNVAKHSGARHAWVTLRQDRQRIDLTVRDDGKGFDPNRNSGLGLLGMKERLRLLHGQLSVESAPGSGTSIVANLPLA